MRRIHGGQCKGKRRGREECGRRRTGAETAATAARSANSNEPRAQGAERISVPISHHVHGSREKQTTIEGKQLRHADSSVTQLCSRAIEQGLRKPRDSNSCLKGRNMHHLEMLQGSQPEQWT